LDEPGTQGRVLIICKYLFGYLEGLGYGKGLLFVQDERDQLACKWAKKKMDLFHKINQGSFD